MAEDDIVVAFGTGSRVPDADEPVGEVVALLEDMLQRAKSGEIRAVAFGTATRGSIASAWTTEGTEYTKYKLVAATALVHNRLLRALDELGSS